jgi:autotransporter-associated beta strand protein
MLTLDNTGRLNATSGVVGANNNDRIADDAVINLEHGWFRINAGSVANTEVLGTVNVNAGTNIVDLYGTDGANVNNILTIGTLNRTAGGTIRITNLDATSTFASAAGPSDSAQLALTTLGAGAALSGGGSAANSTTMSIAQGVFGGNAPIDLTTDFRVLGFNNGNATDLWNQQRNVQFATGSHFMTLDGGFLRPLDNDEYFTAPTGVINSTTLGNTNQNVNLSDVVTIMSQDSTINALRFGALTDHDGTGATGLIDHHGIFLYVDGTLKINSGMISSAYWTVGNTSSATTQLHGGALDFNGKEAIINNQNAYYRTTDGTIQGGDFNIASAITNATGLTKTGFQRVNLLGANTYTGLTTITEGVLDGRHGRTSFGVGGVGNGIVVLGNGELRTNNGISVGTAAAREDIYVGILAGEQQVMRVESDLTQWFSNVTIDNVDAAGHPIFTPRIRTDNNATSIIMGDIAGGDTLISNDVLAIDSRVVQFDSTGNNVFIMRGQFGDRYVGGVAAPIADPISLLPTVAGVRTNENEVLRVNLAGGSDETNLILDRNYNAAGRLTIVRGTLIANYDPAAPDGAGFWTATALSKIPNADSLTTAFNVNGQTSQQGFILGTTGNTYGAVMLARPNQVFNMASWQTLGTGAKHIGGLNQSGTVTFGDGTGTLQHGDNGGTTGAGAVGNLYATDGGTVVFQQRMVGNIGTIANQVFGFLKSGRGTVELRASTAGAATSAPVLGGGTLILNHSGGTPSALVGNTNIRFDGGTLISLASSAANTTASLATADAAGRILEFSIGGNEIVARTTNTGTARNMILNMGNANANGTTPASNFLRGLGATANLVEDNAAGGTAQITLNFNATTTAAVKNQVIPWATFGTLSRTATDFAMSDAGNSNDVRAYTRALDEYQNNVASWAANWDVSENGGAGFSGTLGSALTLSTLRFDANADSIINLGTNVLTVAGNGLASSGGGILVSSNVGSANKTITGGVGAGLTTSGGRVELMVHHYGTGNLNVNVPITGAGVDLVIAGPSTTNAATIGTTGAVVLGATNTYDGQTFINGSVLSFSNVNQLGTNATANAIVMNGGTLRYTGSVLQSLGSKGIDFQGNGGTIDITDGAGDLYLDTAITSNALYRGDLIKVGAGTLTLNGALAAFGTAGNPGFTGLMDIRQGTLRLAVDHGNNTAGNETSEFTTAMGSSNSYMDGTIFRTGTNFAIQMGNANNAGGYSIGEWLTFEGNNYVSVGTVNSGVDNNTADTAGGTELSAPVPNPNNRRPVNLNGVNTINGTVTFDVVPGQTLRLNNAGVGYTTGSGTIIKDGQGTMVIGTNIPDFTGAITILQGRLYAVGQADNLGTGYTAANGSKVITLGSADRQGIAELAPTSDNIAGATFELNHNVNVVYNPAQSKRLLIETFANGSQIELNGNITLNDNLNVYINDAAETGGSTNYVNLNGKLLDGATTSGNLVFSSDDTGNANDNTNGRVNNYLVLRNDNSGWTGDVRVSTHTSFDQDENAILRLEAGNALGAANDVDMGFNSILQVGGNGSSGISGATSGNRTIGSLSTNGGTGPFIGGTAGGTMGASANGTSVIIENAATTAGTLVITQSTPATTEVQWNAYFRNGTLNSEFLAPGATPVASAALNIVKAGNGWATLTLDNDYTGTTTVTGGTLQVGRSGVGDTGNATTNGGLTANAGTTIAGTGQIHGSSTILGGLKPGDEAGGSMGTLTFTAATNLGATSVTTLQVQRSSYTAFNAVGYNDSAFGSFSAGLTTDTTYSHMLNDPVTTAQHDKVVINGALTVTSGAKITLVNNGYTPTHGDVFNLLDWSTIIGTFNVGGTADGNGNGLFRTGAETGLDLNLFELGGAFRWDVSLFNTAGIVVVVVPEPSRALFLMLGLLGLMMRRRRKVA